MSSIIANCAGSVQMTNEPLQYIHPNPIPVWYLCRVIICGGKSSSVYQGSIFKSVTTWVPRRVWQPTCICKTAVSRMLISYGYFLLMEFLAALRFSAYTIAYLHQLSKSCQGSSRCKLIHLRLDDCLNCQFGCSVPQILLMMHDEKSFTLNFRM